MQLRGRIASLALVLGVAVSGFVAQQASASTNVVTTSSGVVTHGATKTTDDTIGWLLTCPVSHSLPDDPIVMPGMHGMAHLHDFTGNASTDAMSTVQSMEAAANTRPAPNYTGGTPSAGTSCNLPTFSPGTAGDTAAYWRPALYANGKQIVSTVKDQLYYRSKPLGGKGFQTIPQDARLIVGSAAAMTENDNPALRDGHLYWECGGVSEVHYTLPPSNCSSKSILENVVFPSCYDGKKMDHSGPNGTDDNHFAYAVNGACPSAFPVKVPQLSEKFKYDNIPAGASLQLSTMKGPGSATTAHADFWNTWQPAALQYLVDKCINAQVSCGTNPLTP